MAVRFATVQKMSFHAYPVWLNPAIFIAPPVFVRVAGTRLADNADAVEPALRSLCLHATIGRARTVSP